MKKLFVMLTLTTISLTACSQFERADKQNLGAATVAVAYRLYPTTNMWTFIKLNTRTGQMWQVQYDVQGANRHEVYLSAESLVSKDNERNDRFALYPTQNIYNFILVDQLDGRVWQAQWSQEAENRAVIPIQ